MKSIFISYNQAYGNEIVELLEGFGQRGFTQWLDIQGRGGVDGIPHYGDHAWPEQNYAIPVSYTHLTLPTKLEV